MSILAQHETTDAEKIRAFPRYALFSATNVVFWYLTVAPSMLTLFLDSMGLDKIQIGGALALLPFCGLVAPFIAPWVSRAGPKRVFMTFWLVRNFVVALLLATPWVAARYGGQASLLFVLCVIGGFALCRAVGETGFYPWFQEIVPDSMRGKFSAANNVIGTVVAVIAVSLAGVFLGPLPHTSQFLWLIGVGAAFGIVSVAFAGSVPGGRPTPQAASPAGGHAREALRDGNFRLYLVGVAMIILGWDAISSFVPLFLKEEVGLPTSTVVLLQNAGMIGGMISCFLWGWAADRYGSKPVMLLGLVVMCFIPLGWMCIPRHSGLSSNVAIGIAFASGLMSTAWGIGSSRQLFVSVIPAARKTQYTSIYYAWVGLIGGGGPLAAGAALEALKGLRVSAPWTVDPYVPLFAAGFVLSVCGVMLLRKTRGDGAVRTREFAGMFLRGNVLAALGSMIKYSLAAHEPDRVSITEKLGAARSPLNVDELLEALADPSFNVRYEAIVSIARTRTDDRLVEALVEIARSDQAELAMEASWALARMGSKSAIEPLRGVLQSPYPMLRARGARALATLGDATVAPELLQQLRQQDDAMLRLAYASALGTLGYTPAIGPILGQLEAAPQVADRDELALAVARLAGREQDYIRLWRRTRRQLGTPAARLIAGWKPRLASQFPTSPQLTIELSQCEAHMARNDLAPAAASLAAACPHIAAAADDIDREVLAACSAALTQHGPARREYILLALHVIHQVLRA